VRRFNFFQYADWTTPSLKGLRNPDVTVRSRGVMEKCTYCIQRINRAKIDAEVAGRPLRDGEVVTACQAVDPSRAIVVGDLHDHDSRVARLRSDPRITRCCQSSTRGREPPISPGCATRAPPSRAATEWIVPPEPATARRPEEPEAPMMGPGYTYASV